MTGSSIMLRHDDIAEIFDTDPGAGSRVCMRTTADKIQRQAGVTGWASPPPPPLSMNWLILGQLGLLLAVVLFVWGEHLINLATT